MIDYPELPTFLQISADERRAAWKGRRLTKQGAAFGAALTKVEDPGTRALRREMERQEEAWKQKELARLADWKARNGK